MNPIFTALIEEAKATNNQSAIAAMKAAVESGEFFVEVIQTQVGQFSMGSTSVIIGEEEIDIPCVYATDVEVMKDIREQQSRYADEIEDGERDDDDEYEGELMVAKWDGGNMMSFHSPDTKVLLGEGEWKWHAGI